MAGAGARGVELGGARAVQRFRALQPGHQESRAAGPRRLQVQPGPLAAPAVLPLVAGAAARSNLSCACGRPLGVSCLQAMLYPGNRGSGSSWASLVSWSRTTSGFVTARRLSSSVFLAPRLFQLTCMILIWSGGGGRAWGRVRVRVVRRCPWGCLGVSCGDPGGGVARVGASVAGDGGAPGGVGRVVHPGQFHAPCPRASRSMSAGLRPAHFLWCQRLQPRH